MKKLLFVTLLLGSMSLGFAAGAPAKVGDSCSGSDKPSCAGPICVKCMCIPGAGCFGTISNDCNPPCSAQAK